MGYQRVDVTFANGRTLENVIVLNAQYLELPDACAEEPITDIQLRVS